MKKAIKALAIVLVLMLSVLCVETYSVQAAKSTIKISKTKKSMREWQTLQLKMKGTTAKVKWTSSNKKVARVTNKGVVIALNKGNSVITAKVKGKKYKCKLKVKKLNGTYGGNSNAIKQIVKSMSYEEKVAQMFWVRCPATTTNAAKVQKKYQFGGYILFGSDFEYATKASAKANIASYQNQSDFPMLIGVDEEGGTVCRVSRYKQFRSTPFLAPRDIFAKGGWNLINSNEKSKANLLKSLGINVNLAPVCDIATNSADYMYSRSFGGTPQNTGKFVSNAVKTSQKNGVATVLKHFPGYGNNVNTHTGIAIDKRSYSTFTTRDFVPFQSGIKAGSGCVLVSHNIVDCMDSKYPASLSSKVHSILRTTLGFKGVIMTDDLSMEAITKYTNGNTAAVQAVLAGNDLLCVDDYVNQYQAVVNAVRSGKIKKSQINASVTRILNWKYDMGIIK